MKTNDYLYIFDIALSYSMIISYMIHIAFHSSHWDIDIESDADHRRNTCLRLNTDAFRIGRNPLLKKNKLKDQIGVGAYEYGTMIGHSECGCGCVIMKH